MKLSRVWLWTVVLASLVAAQTRAAEVALLNSVPANRQLVITINVPGVLQSDPVRTLEQTVSMAELDAKLNEFEQWTGFNPRRDLDRLVVAKLEGHDREDLALLQGEFDKTRLIEALQFNPQYWQGDYRGVIVYGWFDDKEQRQKFGAFLTDNLIVIGTEIGVQEVIDARAEPASSFGARPEIQRVMAGLSQEPVIWAVGRDLGRANKPNPVLSKLPVMLLTINLEPSFVLDIVAEATDARAARNVNLLLNGVIALGRLADHKPDAKMWANGADARQDGNTVELSVTLPGEKFTSLLIDSVRSKNRRG